MSRLFDNIYLFNNIKINFDKITLGQLKELAIILDKKISMNVIIDGDNQSVNIYYIEKNKT